MPRLESLSVRSIITPRRIRRRKFFIRWEIARFRNRAISRRWFPLRIPLTIYQRALNTIDLRQSRFQSTRGATPIAVDVSLTGFPGEPNRGTLVNVAACRHPEFHVSRRFSSVYFSAVFRSCIALPWILMRISLRSVRGLNLREFVFKSRSWKNYRLVRNEKRWRRDDFYLSWFIWLIVEKKQQQPVCVLLSNETRWRATTWIGYILPLALINSNEFSGALWNVLKVCRYLFPDYI